MYRVPLWDHCCIYLLPFRENSILFLGPLKCPVPGESGPLFLTTIASQTRKGNKVPGLMTFANAESGIGVSCHFCYGNLLFAHPLLSWSFFLHAKCLKAKYDLNIHFARRSIGSRGSGMAHKLRRAADAHLCPRPDARL
jgi:hypothetical protein